MALAYIIFLVLICWNTTSGLYFANKNYRTRAAYHIQHSRNLPNNDLFTRQSNNELFGRLETLLLHARSSDDCFGLPEAITKFISYNYEKKKGIISKEDFQRSIQMMTGIDPFNATQVHEISCRFTSK